VAVRGSTEVRCIAWRLHSVEQLHHHREILEGQDVPDNTTMEGRGAGNIRGHVGKTGGRGHSALTGSLSHLGYAEAGRLLGFSISPQHRDRS